MNNIYLVSLGCDKNRVDGQKLLARLLENNYKLVLEPEKAQIIIINTCAFIDDAIKESINTIIEYADYKKNGTCQKLIVSGCLSARYKDEIRKNLPEVDLIISPDQINNITSLINNNFNSSKKDEKFSKRIIPHGLNYEYLKISEGCSKKCSYCAIPMIKGKYKSYKMEDLLEEASFLADNGIKEIILVAQETTLYGIDIYGKKSLHILIQELSKIEGIKYIRIMYAYPEEIYKELIEEIKNNEKICHYIDMPIQHINNNILKNMGRKTTKEELIKLIKNLREQIPDICLRTTVMTGFPGENKKYHKELLNFIEEIKFDRLGAFVFQPQKGTKAYNMKKKVPLFIKNKRYSQIMKLQQQIIFSKNKKFIGSVISGIIESCDLENSLFSLRGYINAPDIDCIIYANYSSSYKVGDIVNVRIIKTMNYDLYGDII